MPRFSTPEPIVVSVNVAAGDVRIIASDRVDTVVDIRPSDASHEHDVRAAEQAQVEHSAGRLLVKSAKTGARSLFGRAGSVDVMIEVPSGSELQADGQATFFQCAGRLGHCRVKTSAGDIQIDHTAGLDASTSAGSIIVDRVAGDADITTGSGKVRLRDVSGNAVVKNSNGDTWIGTVGRDGRIRAANGDVTVDRVQASLTAVTANGDLQIGDAARGSADLKTANGTIDIGVRAGTAARLDVHTSYGTVRNQLTTTDSPDATDDTLEVRARTGYGDIVIRRAPASAAVPGGGDAR